MNKKLTLSASIMLALAVSFSACKKDDVKTDPTPDPPTPATPYFNFAKVGNTASFETSTPLVVQTFTGTMSQEVKSKHGTDVFMVETLLSLGIPSVQDINSTGYWKITNTQFASVDDEQGSKPFPYFTKGDAVNKTYTVSDSGITRTRTVLSVSESVTVPAGTFTCFKVKETNSGNADESVYYFHKDFGLIRTQMKINYQIIGAINIDITLLSKNF
jgi:hypothetical protein